MRTNSKNARRLPGWAESLGPLRELSIGEDGMSIKLMGQVWELKLDHATSYVLIAMADHAKDDGSRCFPSVGYLSWKTNYSIRQVRRILGNLEDTGIIIPVAHQNGGRGYATEYQLVLAAAPRKESYQVAGTELSPNLRIATIARFAQVCQYCNKPGDAGRGPDGKAWQIDRIVPGKRGGLYVSENVTLSCGPCNRQKGAILSPELTEASASTDREVTCLSQKGAICANSVSPMAPQPSGNHQEPLIKPSEDAAAAAATTFDYPEWFQPLTPLKGFKATAHKNAIISVRDGCEEAGVNEADIVRAFADYYRDGGRATNGWSDPVAALVRTLPVQINKTRKPTSRPPPKVFSVNSTDYVAMKAEQDARKARG